VGPRSCQVHPARPARLHLPAGGIGGCRLAALALVAARAAAQCGGSGYRTDRSDILTYKSSASESAICTLIQATRELGLAMSITNCRPEGRQFVCFRGWRTSQRHISTTAAAVPFVRIVAS
jgi:hypothetical protein